MDKNDVSMADFLMCFRDYTTDKDLEKAEALMKDADTHDNPFADRIIKEMEGDFDSKWTELWNVYLHADRDQRSVCDNVLVALCGWTFHSIIGMVEEENLPHQC